MRAAPMVAITLAVVAGVPALCQQIQVNKENRTIAITTNGQADALADTAVVTVGFHLYGKDQEATYAEASRTSNAIMRALTSLGVAKDAVASVQQNMSLIEAGNEGERLRYGQGLRFEFAQSWHVTVLATAAADVLHQAISAGANDSGNIDWELKQDDALEADAAKKALEHARQIAEQMAAGLGAKLGGLLYASNQTPPRGIFASMGLGGMTLETQSASVAQGKVNIAPLAITPQRISRSATVYAVFGID